MKQPSKRKTAIDHGAMNVGPSDTTRRLTDPRNQSRSQRRNSDAGTTGRCATRDVRPVSDTKGRTRHRRRRQMAGVSRRLADNASEPAGAEGGGRNGFGEISSLATRQRQRKTTEWRRQLELDGVRTWAGERSYISAICRRRR